MALCKIQGTLKLSSGLSSRSVHSDFSSFIPSCYSHLTGPLCEIQGLHVHHLLQPVQGQPILLALLCSDSSYGTHFLQWQIHRSHAHIEVMSLQHSHFIHALPTSSMHQQLPLWHS